METLEEYISRLRIQLQELTYEPPEKIVAGVYSRRSQMPDSSNLGYSMIIQPDKSREYAEKQGWTIERFYEDDDFSGKNSNRPGFKEMVEDIKNGRVNLIVVHRLDRLYRNLKSLLTFLSFIKENHVRIVSVTEDLDTETWMGKLSIVLLGVLAENQVSITSGNVILAKERRAEMGLPNGSFHFGYCNGCCSNCHDPNGKNYCSLFGHSDRSDSGGRILVPHPIESHAVRLIANLYSQGFSDAEIARLLNSNRYMLPDGEIVQFRTKGAPGRYLPGQFRDDSIRKIVCSEFNVGMIACFPTTPLSFDDNPLNPEEIKRPKSPQHRRIPEKVYMGQHEPLYPYHLWEQNQKIRKQKNHSPSTQAESRLESGRLLQGLAVCQICHESDNLIYAPLHGSTNGNRGKEYYRCSRVHSHFRGKHGHSHPGPSDLLAIPNGISEQLIKAHHTLPARKLEAQIENLVLGLELPTDWWDSIITMASNNGDLSEFQRKSQNILRETNRVKSMFRNGAMDEADFKYEMAKLQSALESLRPSLQPGADNYKMLLMDFPSIWRHATLHERKELLKSMIARAFFDGQGNLVKVDFHAPFDQLISFHPKKDSD
ncbi:MAG TPA: recombinase family protein [Anaerolineaceae bacterium]|nr:recombinase family protein [Anaerolineaceae bacterium]HPN53949.1 recombinase family protein [Anaerolineaceae bacterium]